jgi:hypothetical protein
MNTSHGWIKHPKSIFDLLLSKGKLLGALKCRRV